MKDETIFLKCAYLKYHLTANFSLNQKVATKIKVKIYDIINNRNVRK